MRIGVVILGACVLLFGGFKILQNMKFDAAVSVSVAKGPFKGVNFKLIDYKVSMNDLKYKNEFWNSPLGKSIFHQLSTTLQTMIIAGSEYVTVEIDVNYWGLMKQHYSIKESGAKFEFGVMYS